MTKIKLSIALLLIITVTTFAQKVVQTDAYQFSIDLVNVVDDKLEVSLITPKISGKSIVYNIPKIVPGTYSNDDYGRYVSNFKAFDKKGKALSISKEGPNSYKIKKANKLFKISYKVDDSWDSPEIKGSHIFEPAGTNIEKDSAFAINTHGFFGYFDGMKSKPYEITFLKPEGFYGSTSMEFAATNSKFDLFKMPAYQPLVDAPILYCKPDTTTLNIGGAKILVSVYAPNKMANTIEIGANIKNMLEAQKEYLGGTLPIDKYAFLIVLADGQPGNSYGALEHSYSSFYYLPESSSDELSQTIKDVASHEFFHIVTPLSIHAEQIGDFDYNNPKMSKHLWMYEGLTEYASSHMQIKHNLIEMPAYLKVLREKVLTMQGYNDAMPFTEMSKNVLDEKVKDQYNNVYNKGALIGLCLDIKLRQLSEGKYGTQNMVKDLSKTYGKNVSFKDDELFDKIESFTFPEIRKFFSRFVEGSEPLPVKEYLELVGIKFIDSEEVSAINLGNVGLSYNPESQRLFIVSTEQISDFGRKVGYLEKDEIISLNGDIVNLETYKKVLTKFKETAKEGDDFKIVVMRKNSKDIFEEKTLSAKLEASKTILKNVIDLMEEPTIEQVKLRDAWLNPKNN